MRLTSTITVTFRDVVVTLLVFGTGAMSVWCMWILINGGHRYIEQPLGAKIQHRQSGWSALKNITRHVVNDQKSKHVVIDHPLDAEQDTQDKESERIIELNREMYPEEYALSDVGRLTSSAKSTYRIEGDRENIKLGDTLHVIIRAKDGRNRDRDEGGDFWFATLTNKRGSSGTAGRVVDYDNGTYSVYFTVGWPGAVSLEITLVHPSHVVAALANVIWLEEDRVVWDGRFEWRSSADGTLHREVQRCVLRRQYAPLVGECVISRPKSMGNTLLVCRKPGEGIPCDGLVGLSSNITAISHRIQSITRNYYNVFSGVHFKSRLTRGPSQLQIEESEELRQKLLSDQERLPVCLPDQTDPKTRRGYWEKNRWHSLLCRAKHWESRSDIGECLRGKETYLLGGTTLRRWTEELLEVFGASFPKTSDDEQQIRLEIEAFNASLISWINPLVSNLHGGASLYQELQLEAEFLDKLGSLRCDYVVVISAWESFPQWRRDSYVEYVGLLRDAVLRLMARCPGARVVVTGPHPRDQPSKDSRIYYNDLITYRLGRILEDAFSFSKETGVLYLDLWDLNLSYPVSKKLHMPKEVIRAELSMFLSYVCGA